MLPQSYFDAIDKFTAELKTREWNKPEVWQDDPWEAFVKVNPDAIEFIRAVDKKINYELSWNQASMAVSRLLKE